MNKVSMIVWNEFLNDARVLKEAETLQTAGYRVTVHALHTPGKTLEYEVLPSGVKVVRVSRSPLWKLRKSNPKAGNQSTVPAVTKNSQPLPSMKVSRQILRLLARTWTHLGLLIKLVMSKPDVVHAHDVNVLLTAWLAAVLSGSPLVYDAHEISTDREGYQAFRKVVGWIEKRLMPRAVACITTTDMRAKFFSRAYKIPRPVVLQNRPRRNHYDRTEHLREVLGLTEEWPIVLYQGGLQQGRGLALLVRCAAQVKNAYFVLIGGGRQEAELKKIVTDMGLNDIVFFIPTVSLDELPLYTASADIGVQPIENTCLNHFSTDSNKLFEYIQAGLPVVVSDFPEIRKVVEEYDLGILVEQGNTTALADALNGLLVDESKREQVRCNAVKAAENLNWEAQEHMLIELYQRI